MTFIKSDQVYGKVMQSISDELTQWQENDNYLQKTFDFFAFKLFDGMKLKTLAGTEMIVWGERIRIKKYLLN